MPKSMTVKLIVIAQFKKQLNKEKTLKPYFEIDFKELEIVKHVAEGGFGVIYKAKWRETQVAVKILKPDLLKEETIKDFLCELNRRVQRHGVFETPKYRYVSRSVHQVPKSGNRFGVLLK